MSATSNSVAIGEDGRLSEIFGGFSVGFWFTLSTTTTAIFKLDGSNFSPSCLSIAANMVITSAPAAAGPIRKEYLKVKSHAPLRSVLSTTGRPFKYCCPKIIPRIPSANAFMVIFRHVYTIVGTNRTPSPGGGGGGGPPRPPAPSISNLHPVSPEPDATLSP